MKYTYIVMVATFITVAPSVQAVNITSPYFSFRSQGINLAREFAGWQQHTYKHHVKEWHGSFFVAPSYTQSTNDDAIASIIFGPDLQHEQNSCEEFIRVSGSQVPYRKNHDWLADYFGLPTDFQSTIAVNPRIRNFILDLDLFLAVNWKCHNLFVQIHAPYVYSTWNLNFNETVQNPGTNDYTALYMTPDSVNRGNLLNNASAFFAGYTPALGQSVVFDPLSCAKINNQCNTHSHHIADLQINIGTYLLTNEDYHVGLALRVVVPTGTHVNGEYIFQPIVGNGHHWELGANGNIYVLLWKHQTETKKLMGSAVANLTYMFKTTQTRSFDLFDKPNSRYMLAERLASSPRLQPQLTADCDPVGIEFQNELAPLANITQANVFAGSNFQADAVFAITYTTGNLSVDLGYNYWFRGCEDVRIKDRCKPQGLNGNSWALKGDAYVFGFADNDPYYGPNTVRLAATEQRATIRSGTNNYPSGVDGVTSFQNAGVDNRTEAFSSTSDDVPTEVTAINGLPMYTSLKPILLTLDSIDLTGTQGISDKLFAHVSYTWHYNKTYSFFLGAGGEYEIGKCTSISDDHKDCPTSCLINDCLVSSLSQWGVWIKGGFSFE